MGYYVKITDCKININKVWFYDACRHLLNSDFLVNKDKMSGVSYDNGMETNRWYAWVDMKQLENCLRNNNLIGVFKCFNFSVEERQGNIVGLGYDQKSGDQEHLLYMLREYVDDEDFVEFQGENSEKWRYFFSNSYMYVQEPIIVWSATEIFK